MKKIALAGTTLALAMAAGSAFAANDMAAGTMGLNISVPGFSEVPTIISAGGRVRVNDFIINGKYFVAKDMALLAGIGLRVNGGDLKGTDIGFLVGARKYLKTEDFAPFIGGRFVYTNTNDSNLTTVEIGAEAGAEYFLGKQFSLEGRVGFGYISAEFKQTNQPTIKGTLFGTTSYGLGANYYF